MWRRTLKRIGRVAWVVRGRVGPSVGIDGDATVAVVVASYRRPWNIDPLARSVLRCTFVESLTVTNHAPDVAIERWMSVNDPRLTLSNELVSRGSAYRWVVAARQRAQYLLVVDDDLLVFPGQLRRLFEALLGDPSVPHGLAGSVGSRYRERCETEVDTLHQIYAVTRDHVARFLDLARDLSGYDCYAADSMADDILISRCGDGRPKVHDAGPLLRCVSSDTPGIAMFRDDDFQRRNDEVVAALAQVAESRRVPLAAADGGR